MLKGCSERLRPRIRARALNERLRLSSFLLHQNGTERGISESEEPLVSWSRDSMTVPFSRKNLERRGEADPPVIQLKISVKPYVKSHSGHLCQIDINLDLNLCTPSPSSPTVPIGAICACVVRPSSQLRPVSASAGDFRLFVLTLEDFTGFPRLLRWSGWFLSSVQNPEMLTRKIKLWDINTHITCRLCEGYLIDATTVTECLHTFCRSCLVNHDRTMQDIVYKLVPGLQEAEMRKQREFYQKLGMEVPGELKAELCSIKLPLECQRNGEQKSEEATHKEAVEEKPQEENDYHRSDEQVSICLECNSSKLRGLKRKWIRCSAQATVLHLKKFIAKKLNLTSFNELDILCNEEILGKDHTLKFVVVTRWRFKKSPLLLHYRPKMDLL
ncbi:hypothetical protein DNTS_020402 [Danionella cerebrum]|uniref:RING-type domain-containing protein n=1 Tax=Danionella cerebrum TaxID=2873325 RepID=A0A553QMF3_9TELE|nr:hypothetical protein DNTS_020402 [Danionella translucida]